MTDNNAANSEQYPQVRVVRCYACGELVRPIQITRTVMRHQDAYVNGFTLSVNDTKCPKCGERRV